MTQIHDLGKKMVNTQSMQDLLNYKEAIKTFVSFVVKNSVTIRKITAKHRSPFLPPESFKQYSTIETIDENLEKLSIEFLSMQRNNLELLKQVDEIQGLMLNLLI